LLIPITANGIQKHYIKKKGVGQMRTAPKNPTTTPEPLVINRQIGSTLYKVGIHFNPHAKETLDEKIRRLLKNDLKSAPENVTMKPLQASWLSERKII
jgi:hypothetical protein